MSDTAYLERALIGSLLLRPDKVTEALPLQERDFAHDPLCRALWLALRDQCWGQGPIDVADVAAALAPDLHPTLRSAASVAELSVTAPLAANIATYARLIRDASTRRDVIALGYRLTDHGGGIRSDPARLEQVRADLRGIRLDPGLQAIHDPSLPTKGHGVCDRVSRPVPSPDRLRAERAVLGASIHDDPPGSRLSVQQHVVEDMFASLSLRQAWRAVADLGRRVSRAIGFCPGAVVRFAR